MRLLIVEDEPNLGRQLKSTLEGAGYAVDLATDGEDGHFLGSTESYDAAVLDLGLPEIDGLTVLDRWRKEGKSFPVLVLTARDSWSDKVAGLDAGADDYLVKPFSIEELLARVRALLRRTQKNGKAVTKLEFGDITVDLARQTATRGKRELHLTPKEFAMLRLLSATPGEPVSRERFLDVVWGYAAFPTTRTVDNHVASLRRKLEKNPDDPRWLKTVHGVGYKLEL